MSEQIKEIGQTKPREGMLKITEIFHSLQGEALQAGLPTVFVRLTGCPLRCTYCDSEYAFYGGEWMHFDDILDAIRTAPTPLCLRDRRRASGAETLFRVSDPVV